MTTIALYHKHYSKDHLAEVKNEMVKLGAPRIRAIWSDLYGMWLAVEGCHRLRAAQELGLTPEIIDITNDDEVTVDGRDGTETYKVFDLHCELNDLAPKTEVIDF